MTIRSFVKRHRCAHWDPWTRSVRGVCARNGAAPAIAFCGAFGGNEASDTGEANAGDPDGRGSATVIISDTSVCFGIVVDGIDGPTAAHIHRAVAGVNGDIVVVLTPPSAGDPGASSGCVPVNDPALLTAIRRDPSAFYVNVHTGEFPAGAIRGQLF
jgi:CHRD domain